MKVVGGDGQNGKETSKAKGRRVELLIEHNRPEERNGK
jgi:hypothetical protein